MLSISDIIIKNVLKSIVYGFARYIGFVVNHYLQFE
jgi:hypothetical protein